jgi:putative Mn2+ efflux pump MntP
MNISPELLLILAAIALTMSAFGVGLSVGIVWTVTRMADAMTDDAR